MITTTQTTSILISHPLERLFPLAATQQAAGGARRKKNIQNQNCSLLEFINQNYLIRIITKRDASKKTI